MEKIKQGLPPIPVVGQEIYVSTQLHLSHGKDDVLGGLAIVTRVWKDKHDHCIQVKEHPNSTYYWRYLAENQEEWKKEYGDKRARQYPDTRPEFNSGSVITRDVIRRWLVEGKTEGATHVIVVSDTFDYTYYPVYVMSGENPREVAQKLSVQEVYSLNHNIEEQLNKHRSFRFD